ncbi:hypothetical protein [Micromonospora sp. CPCC 206061]|uniref:hypothetical protein n=1 Tax=Micromonospora sp. CPCC 206061 TaxID=3122410 RepID=UPI002FF2057D
MRRRDRSRARAVEPPELLDVRMADQPSRDQLAAMAPREQFSGATPTCGLLMVREPADTADPSRPIAACHRDDTLATTKYLLDPRRADGAGHRWRGVHQAR